MVAWITGMQRYSGQVPAFLCQRLGGKPGVASLLNLFPYKARCLTEALTPHPLLQFLSVSTLSEHQGRENRQRDLGPDPQRYLGA